MKRHLVTGVASLVLALAASRSALGQTGSAFTYQGRVTNSGVLIDGTISVQLSLWKDAFANLPADRIGAVQTINGVAVNDGVFTVIANLSNEFGLNPFNGQAVWLQVAINGVNQSPRRQILSTPYASGLAAGGGATNSSLSTTTLTLINQSTSTTATGVGTGAGALLVRRGNASGVSLAGYYPGALQVDTANVNGVVTTVSSPGAYGIFGLVSGNGASGVVGHARGFDGTGVRGIADEEGGVGVAAIANGFDATALTATANANESIAFSAVTKGTIGRAIRATTEKNNSVAITALSGGDYSLALEARATGIDSTALVATAEDASSMAAAFRGPVFINDTIGTAFGSGPRVPLEVRVAPTHTLQFRFDQFTPGINVNSTGGNPGILRLRNAMEIWPSDDGTRAGKLDVRNAAGSPTITLNGANGNINATGTITPSSGMLKQNIVPIGDALAKVQAMNGVRYDWIESEATKRGGRVHDMGFVAEDVEKLFPEVVFRDEDGKMVGMDYSRLTAVAVQAIKQLRGEKDAEIAELKARLERLERAIENGR